MFRLVRTQTEDVKSVVFWLDSRYFFRSPHLTSQRNHQPHHMGNVSEQVLLIGFIDSFIVALIVVFFTVYFIKRSTRLDELNKFLQSQIKMREEMEETLVSSEQRFRQMAENIMKSVLGSVAGLYRGDLCESPLFYEKISGHWCQSLYRNPMDSIRQ